MNALKLTKKIGLSPGSLVYVGDKTDAPIKISIIDYNADRIDIIENATIAAIRDLEMRDTVTWVNISGVNNIERGKLGTYIRNWGRISYYQLTGGISLNRNASCRVSQE